MSMAYIFVPSKELNQVDDVILYLIFKNLDTKHKVAFERVSKRFRRLVFRNCQQLNFNGILSLYWREIIFKINNLRTIKIPSEQLKTENASFGHDLALFAPKLEVIDSGSRLIKKYLWRMFKRDPNYDGNHFKSLINLEDDHPELLYKFPRSKVGCYWTINQEIDLLAGMEEDEDDGDKRLSSNQFIRRVKFMVINDKILSKAVKWAPNVSIIKFHIQLLPSNFHLDTIFDAMTGLPLTKFSLSVGGVAEDHESEDEVIVGRPPLKMYVWRAQDETSFENLITIPTLRHIEIHVYSRERYQRLMEAFTSCPRTDFKSFTISFKTVRSRPMSTSWFKHVKNIPVMNFVQRFKSKSRIFTFKARDKKIRDMIRNEVRQFRNCHPDYKFFLRVGK